MLRPLPLAAALVLACSPTLAKDALTWEGAAPAVYTLELTPPATPPQRAEALQDHAVVHPSGFLDGRVPRAPIASLSDLVWHHALLLPSDELPRKKGKPLEATRSLSFSGSAVESEERHQLVRVGRKKAAIQSRIMLRTQVTTLGWTQVGLELERVFDPQAQRLEACSLRLVWVQADGQQFVYTGTIAAQPPVDTEPTRFAARVEEAIGRGRAALLKLAAQARAQQGHALGRTALACFALLRSGVPPADLDPYFAFMAQQKLDHTYSVALYVMALEARSVARTPASAHGGTVARFDRGQVPARDKAEIERATAWLLAARKPQEGWWSYGGHSDLGPTAHDGKTPATAGDRSNSQFAVLALHSALASGVDVPPAVWQEILDEHHVAQETKGDPGSLTGTVYLRHSAFFDPAAAEAGADAEATRARGGKEGGESAALLRRGWAYGTHRAAGNGSAYGSMTSAGLSSLAVAREALADAKRLSPEHDRQAKADLQSGLAWLAHRFDPSQNPGRGHSGWFFYYLYSVEKAMDLVGVERLGPAPWWQLGAIELLYRQDATDGSWTKTLEDTAFALLFLNRATLPAKLEIEAAGRVLTGAEQAWDALTIPDVGRVRASEVLRSLTSVSKRELRERLKLAEACLDQARPAVQGRLLAELAPLLEHSDKAVKRFAKKRARDLVKRDDPAELRALGARFADVQAWGEDRDYAQIPALVALLEGDAPDLLRAEVLRVVGALRAVEATPALLPGLEASEADDRRAHWQIVVGLLRAGLEFDPEGPSRQREEQVAALRTYWDLEGKRLLREAQIQRAVEDLARPERAAAAEETLTVVGEQALRPLVDALRSEASRSRAHALLKKLSGKDLPPDPAAWLHALGE
ncbi:MAG: hypothetical protein R3F62_08430 [Planctomycetota bacterium]